MHHLLARRSLSIRNESKQAGPAVAPGLWCRESKTAEWQPWGDFLGGFLRTGWGGGPTWQLIPTTWAMGQGVASIHWRALRAALSRKSTGPSIRAVGCLLSAPSLRSAVPPPPGSPYPLPHCRSTSCMDSFLWWAGDHRTQCTQGRGRALLRRAKGHACRLENPMVASTLAGIAVSQVTAGIKNCQGNAGVAVHGGPEVGKKMAGGGWGGDEERVGRVGRAWAEESPEAGLGLLVSQLRCAEWAPIWEPQGQAQRLHQTPCAARAHDRPGGFRVPASAPPLVGWWLGALMSPNCGLYLDRVGGHPRSGGPWHPGGLASETPS